MRLSFPILVVHRGDKFTATVTPSNHNGDIIYDVNDGVNVFALTAHDTKDKNLKWIQHITGDHNDLIQAIGEAIERANIKSLL